jgi:hypothetical protein
MRRIYTIPANAPVLDRTRFERMPRLNSVSDVSFIRVLIVPPSQGYGNSGSYGREMPGKNRFHISPNITLVYEVEVLDITK